MDQARTIIEVTAVEAEYTLETVEMVFQDLYVARARIDDMTKRLENRKQAAQSKQEETDDSREGERTDA